VFQNLKGKYHSEHTCSNIYCRAGKFGLHVDNMKFNTQNYE